MKSQAPDDATSPAYSGSMPWQSDMNPPLPALATIYRSASRRDCLERGLALDAIGVPYELHATPAECVILVRSADAARAAAELEDYASENHDELAPATTPPPPLANAWTGVFVYFIVVMLVTGLKDRGAFDANWMTAGCMNAGLVRAGEWWRVVTALTLHLDLLHLAGNVLFGVLFGLFVGQLLGSGLAWLSILLAGAIGNAINGAVQSADHMSVGASTAVFAALGILAALDWTQRRRSGHQTARRWIPIIGGAALLAMTGLEGEHTDFVAHICGFLGGLILGRAAEPVREQALRRPWLQVTCGIVAVATVVFAWGLALQNG